MASPFPGCRERSSFHRSSAWPSPAPHLMSARGYPPAAAKASLLSLLLGGPHDRHMAICRTEIFSELRKVFFSKSEFRVV